MPAITYITRSGSRVAVETASGTLMEAALEHGIEGIDGSCGGVCSCATCHVRITPEWRERVGPATEVERSLLDFEDNACAGSRLSCQIELTIALDGLVVEVVN